VQAGEQFLRDQDVNIQENNYGTETALANSPGTTMMGM
jgi:hypothetical protein